MGIKNVLLKFFKEGERKEVDGRLVGEYDRLTFGFSFFSRVIFLVRRNIETIYIISVF